MRVKSYKWVLFLAALFAQLVFLCPCVYAGDEASLSMTISQSVNWNMMPGNASTAKFPISIITDNANGYLLKMETSGESTDLVNKEDNSQKISNLTLPAGRVDIPLNSLDNSYGFSMDGINFRPVPETGGDGVVIAENYSPSIDEPNEHELTFGAKVDRSVPAGTYENTFTITAIAMDPSVCEAGYICYDRNGGDMDGSLEKQLVGFTKNDAPTKVDLTAPDYSKSGYGFAGWNTKRDGEGISYGPNEAIETEKIINNGMTLYAKWVKSEGTLQEWNGCENMAIGDVIGLTDSRDGNTYAIAKLPDKGCWMVENLRLDLSKSGSAITSENTNNPTPEFIEEINRNPSSKDEFCTDTTKNCINRINFNTSNIDIESESYWSSYGGYYNWYTATAGNGTFSKNNSKFMVFGDICPAGWSLPTGYGDSGDLTQLDIALGGNGKNATTAAASERWRRYPNNLIYSGEFNKNAIITIGETGNYHTANPSDQTRALNLWMRTTAINFNSNGGKKINGHTMRCVYNKHYKIHFDANSDKMADGEVPDLGVSVGVKTTLPKSPYNIENAESEGYKFIGWNTEADGSGESFDDEGEILDLARAGETVTLYAQWEVYRFVDVTVKFVTNGISKVSLISDEYASFEVTENNTIVKLVSEKTYRLMVDLEDGYEFVGYNSTLGGVLIPRPKDSTLYVVSSEASLSASAKVRTTKLYLQNMEFSSCSSTPKIAYDIRDEEPYYIQRLADNRCWMIDNLRISNENLTEQLSIENTNMPEGSNFTLPESSEIRREYGRPMINTDNKNDQPTSYGTGGSKTTGTYYNYCAITAGTVCEYESPQDAEYDICPAGWRLPTGGENGETDILFNAYGRNVSNMRNAASIVLGGWFDSNNIVVKERGSITYLWTSTHSNVTNKSYAMMFNKGSIDPKFGGLETNGLSARCVMK